MRNLAIIPARGGSKRIPRKNIRPFLGKPIISYSIEICLSSGLFDEVMVSTDDEEIAKWALDYGAKVPFIRSSKNADDFATTTDVINEVISNYKSLGQSFDFVCCVYATSPLIETDDLIRGLDRLMNNTFNVVYPVAEYSYPIWRGIEVAEDFSAKMIWPENINTRSQDLNRAYHDAGQWYWLKPQADMQGLLTNNPGVIVLDPMKVQDIDTMEDWKIAELKYKLLIDGEDSL
jgi:pseudaminic acid cytidylyltransferase